MPLSVDENHIACIFQRDVKLTRVLKHKKRRLRVADIVSTKGNLSGSITKSCRVLRQL